MAFNPAIPPSVAGDAKAPAIHQASGWLERVLPYLSNRDDEDNFLLVSASITGAGTVLWAAIKWFRENASEIKWAADRIRGVKPPEAEVIDGIFKTSDSFFDGVRRVKDGWQKMEPEDALEAGLRWVYENHPRYNGLDGRPPALNVTAADIEQLMKTYGFTPTQIGNVAYVVNQRARERRWPLTNDSDNIVWEEITSAIIENVKPRKASSLPPAGITTTQKLLEGGRKELESINSEVTRTLFEKLARSLATTELPQEGSCHVSVGSEWIVVREAGSALESVHGILGRLSRGEELDVADGEFIEALKKDNPVVQRIYEIATTPSREGIDGKRRLLQLMRLAEAREATSRGISAFFDAVSDKRGPVLLIVYDETGKKLFPRMIVRGLADGGRLAEYERPYYAGMSSYHPGEAYIVNGKALTKADAAMVVDSRGKPFFIIESDMEHFKKLAEAVTSTEPASKSYLGRAYLRFFNTIQAIYLMTNPDYKLAGGTPSDVPDRARWLGESNWVRALDTDINLLRQEYFNVSARMLGKKIEPQNGHGEAIETRLHAAVGEAADRYVGKFGKTRQPEFRRLARQLERAILEENSEALQTVRGQIRKLAVDQIGGHKRWVAWIQLQDVAGDSRLFRRVSPNKFLGYLTDGKAEPPADVRNFVAVWTSDADHKPSLEAARRYAKDSSEKAFAEYDLLIRSDSADANTTITALAELAELSYGYNQIPRAGRALDMVDYMLLSGYRLPERARDVLLELITGSDKDPLLRMDIPYNLRSEVAGKAEVEPPVNTASQLGKRLGKRLDALPSRVRDQLSAVVEEFRGETIAYSRDFLARVAVCMDDREFWRFVRGSGGNYLTVAKSVEEQNLLRPFYERARGITGVYTRSERLPRAAKTALKPLLEIWCSRGYDGNFLTALAVATPAEAEGVRTAFGVSDDKIDEVGEFQRKARGMIGEDAFEKLDPPPKVAEARVEAGTSDPRPSLSSEPPMTEQSQTEQVAPSDFAPSSVVDTLEIDESVFRPWYKNAALETFKTTRDIGVPVVWGAATFLGSEYLLAEIFGEPTTPAWATVQGYGTMGLAMTVDHGVRAGIRHFLPMPQYVARPFTFGGFAGNIGISMVVYRAVAGASDAVGVDELIGEKIGPFDTNEVIGLLGAGGLYGASYPVLAKISPAVAYDLARHGTETFAYTSKWSPYVIKGVNVIKTAGAVLFVTDTATNVTEAITGGWDPIEKSYAVSECAEDVSLPGVSFFLPSYYKLLCRVYSGDDMSNYAALLKKRDDRHSDDAMMRKAAAEFVKWFSYELQKTASSRSPIPLIQVIEKSYNQAWGNFQQWETFQNNYIKGDQNKNWLFRTGAIKDGKLKEAGAVASWLQPHLLEVLTDFDDSEATREIVERYREELENISLKYHHVRNDGIWPAQL